MKPLLILGDFLVLAGWFAAVFLMLILLHAVAPEPGMHDEAVYDAR